MAGIALPSAIVNLIQQNLLVRHFEDALFPEQRFRNEAVTPEVWEANVGQTQIYSRQGLLGPKTKPNTAGQDPAPRKAPDTEQWAITCNQYADSIDTHMPSSRVQLASQFLVNSGAMAKSAGQSLNHLVRNRMYNPYLTGNTYASAAASATNILPVANLNGFTYVLYQSRPVPVSGNNPLAITVNGVAVNVIGFTPNTANDVLGPGTLTLDTAVTCSIRDAVLAYNRAKIIRSGGASTVNGIASTNKLTLADLRAGVAYLKTNNVPPHPDGYYHMQHTPTSNSQLFADTEFQNIYRGNPTNKELLLGTIAKSMGVKFVENNECPTSLNCNINLIPNTTTIDPADDYIAADLVVQGGSNAGVPIERPILTGGFSMIEKYVPQDAYLTAAGTLGKVGGFDILPSNGGVGMILDRIRWIIRTPMNRLQDVVAVTYAFEGDWAVPSDALTGTPATFKRMVVFEHAGAA